MGFCSAPSPDFDSGYVCTTLVDDEDDDVPEQVERLLGRQ